MTPETNSVAYVRPGIEIMPYETQLRDRVESLFMPWSEITRNTRKREIVYIRQSCAHLLRANAKEIVNNKPRPRTLYWIAHQLGMNHSTVVYSCRQVTQALEGYNNELKSYYEILKP